MLRRIFTAVSIAITSLVLASPALVQTPRPARTPTGFYYPINDIITNDRNWLACGSSYYPNIRHIGTDLIYSIGTSVYTIAPGKVLYKSGPKESSGWGIGNYALAIRHSASTGDFIAVYGHIRTSLNVGDTVYWGQSIGTIGRFQETVNGKLVDRTPHLHFGVYPSATGFPLSGWGRISDVGCKNPNKTNGFVAPITWINTKTPKG